MGEATYYMRATWSNPATLSQNQASLTAFLEQGYYAEQWWQQNRNRFHLAEKVRSASDWFAEFKQEFPLVFEYLESFYDFHDLDNGLASVLNFPDPWEQDIDFSEHEMRYHGTVWHFADWDPLARFIESKYGADQCKWISEEQIDPWDSV